MKECSTKVQPIPEPVWLGLKLGLIPHFIITPKHGKETSHLPHFIQKMKAENMNPAVIKTFQHYYANVCNGADGMIGDNEITRINPVDLVQANQLAEFSKRGKKALNKAVMIVLNGGLGTSMGLDNAKSLIPVKSSRSFMEITINQASQQGVRLCFMNSFTTHRATLNFIAARNFSHPVMHFMQNKFPKILRDTLAPANWRQNPSLEWNPPGHGDIYTAMYASGTLGRLLDAGIKYAFISNADNLSGTLDESLLGYFVESKLPFMMEVSKRNPSDIKGGHIARRKDGRLVLREISQCPQNDLMNFQDILHHCFFNTNNIWIDLEELNKRIKNDGLIRLPMILNPKSLDPRKETSPPVYQIETAMGSAISLFEGARAVAVERDRFSPVKTCNDLLVLRSDRILLTHDSKLIPNPENKDETIHVQLDPKFYGKIDGFQKRFPFGTPSLTRCNSLTVEGDVRFERNVVLKGRVVICNKRKNQEIIKAGSIITGDLQFEPVPGHVLRGSKNRSINHKM
ncbi:MAG: UTP--glucose-1-phosphate uridylyltransferase [Desulfamplus sp.]|nr:UTP--glucose-1-phosphate uridylyltransferase [Desulfamplus sp.]